MAALLELNPRDPREDDESLAWRMADWALLQGPSVRWDAMLQAARAMIDVQNEGRGFIYMSEIGLEVLKEYNLYYGGGRSR